MTTVLSLLQILSLPLMFGFAIAYFIELHGFNTRLVKELPEVWTLERARARPMESWAPTAYKLMQRTKGGVLDGHPVSSELEASRLSAVKMLYTTVSCFMDRCSRH
ncbi:hypothetical protein AB4059_04020 [Lysobacter sp. 2RAF19]